jgi:lipopolysaccharide/colanic/teichoic acid biosynthesis glycosyltransferase
MSIINKREPIVLFLGDIIVFYGALWLAYFLRFSEIPGGTLFKQHLLAFSLLFVFWAAVFFVFGLYDKKVFFFRGRLKEVLLKAHLVNSIISFVYFYTVPFLGINPKITLVLYLLISFILVIFWRVSLSNLIFFKKRESAILVGEGVEMKELKNEVNSNDRYGLFFDTIFDLNSTSVEGLKNGILQAVKEKGILTIVIDFRNIKTSPALVSLHDLVLNKARFLDINDVYEDVFDRVPLFLIGHNWFAENVPSYTESTYDILKRLMDIILGIILGIFTLLITPFVALAIKLDDGGKVFTKQERVGQNNDHFYVFKFRTLERIEEGVWHKESKNNPTRIGKILRVTSIDELPQILNILKGELSFIGPRSDLASLEERLRESLPYYSMRYIVRPGISGWAQVNQQYAPGHINPQTIDENKVRLAYDLYYVKNRSLMLDLVIALRTIQTLLSRTGK